VHLLVKGNFDVIKMHGTTLKKKHEIPVRIMIFMTPI